MNHIRSRRRARHGSPPRPPRADVLALRALLALDEDIQKREARVAQTLALSERASSEVARLEPEVAAAREELARREQGGEDGSEVERLRRALDADERQLTQLLRLAEKTHAEAAEAASALREASAGVADRRGAAAGQIPEGALADYEDARRRGLSPPAVATRGVVCWGCFHHLSAETISPFTESHQFAICPHCDRLLFNPDWTEER